MTLPKVPELRALLHGLPIEDKLATLLFAILDDDTNALNCSQRLIWAIRRLSEHQSSDNRFMISETLHDLADKLERPAVAHVD